MERSKPFFDGEVDLFADFPEPEDKVEVDPDTEFKPEDFDFKEEPAEEIDFDAEPDNYFEVSFTTPEGQEIVAATSDNDTAGQLSHVETPMDLLNALISELGLEDQVELVDKDEEKSEEVPTEEVEVETEETKDAADETEAEETEVEDGEEIEESCKETVNECNNPKLVESQIDDFDTQIQSDELAELQGAVDPELTPEDYENETVVDAAAESPLTPEERKELLALFGITPTDESLTVSKVQKDAEKHSELATENKPKNLTLNEEEAHDEANEIDYYEQDIRDAIKLLARKGKAEFWCL